MIQYNNNLSMLLDGQAVSRSKYQKRFAYNNISQTETNMMKQAWRSSQRSILPFSLKHKQHNKLSSHPYSQDPDSHNNTNPSLDQSGLSQNILKKFQSRNAIGLYKHGENIESEEQRVVVDGNSHNSHHSKRGNSGQVGNKMEGNVREKLQMQHQMQCVHGDNNGNLIMLQIHITIAKKKYTLKVSNQITTQDLQSLIQHFLQQNSISNPLKKSHNKTKRSIVEMVQNKIRDGNNSQYKRLSKKARESQTKDMRGNEENDGNRQNYYQHNVNQREHNAENKQHEKRPANNSHPPGQPHLIKPSLLLKLNQPTLKTQNNDSINQDNKFQYEEEQVHSPSFKSSVQHVEKKSPLKRTSRFSPEPKHQDNKYQKIVANYYNQSLTENDQQWKENYGHNNDVQKSSKSPLKMSYNQHRPAPVPESPTFTQNNSKFQDTINISQNDFEQQKAKSVYEKWKQREKSKEINGKANESQKLEYPLRQRKITDNSFVSQMSEQKKQEKREKNWKNGNGKNKIDHKRVQRALHSVSVHEQKQIQKRLPPKSPMNNKNRSKQNFSMNRSTHEFKKVPSHHQRNRTMAEEDYSPNKVMNKTQVIGSKMMVDNEGFQSNKYIRGVKEVTERSVTPKKAKASTNLPKTPTINQNQSKVYTICDQDSYTVHEMSPDHFYKQGLVFQAKKKQEMEDKFKSLYPFTTRNIKDLHEIENGASRNGTMRNGKENSGVSEKSKDKYFSSKLSMNKNITTKSSANIHLEQKEKSALHERLYQENKVKQTKITASEANQRLIKLSKPSQNQNQMKIMQENLKNIKGLSQEKKIKLIQRNIKIKEKIKEKDRMIDQELQKMIKQGKVKPAYHLAQVSKSPFRKTQIF